MNWGIAFPLVCDVSNRQDVRSAMERCENELGPIDCLIANAGIGGITGPENFDSTIVERIIQTNLVGPAYCIEQILPGMIARKKKAMWSVLAVLLPFKAFPILRLTVLARPVLT